LIDYASFYSRCFEDIPKKVTRVHFFYGNPKHIEGLVKLILNSGLDKAREAHDKLIQNYIGFTTLRPIHRKVIGKTAFIQYPSSDGESNLRHYPVFIDNNVHIAGIPFSVNALPFQEQDTAVAACATTAIWSALPAIRKKFDIGTYYSPYEITNLAFEASDSTGNRRFPNEGLGLNQILNVIMKMGFDPQFFDVNFFPTTKYFDELVIAHLEFGLPVLAALRLSNDTSREGHLVTIAGYKCVKGKKELSELYVHDDQIGFYSRSKFTDATHKRWTNEWITHYKYKEIEVIALIIPYYHKIRLSYSCIYKLCAGEVSNDDSFDICLMEGSQAKQRIMLIGVSVFTDTDAALKFLQDSSPKYLWYVELRYNTAKAIILFDATSYRPCHICHLTYK
jgi:hypothetical protein